MKSKNAFVLGTVLGFLLASILFFADDIFSFSNLPEVANDIIMHAIIINPYYPEREERIDEFVITSDHKVSLTSAQIANGVTDLWCIDVQYISEYQNQWVDIQEIWALGKVNGKWEKCLAGRYDKNSRYNRHIYICEGVGVRETAFGTRPCSP